MTQTQRLSIGILGGMGPQATLDLQQKIIDATAAVRDQDHFDVWVANLASIPDRLAAIHGSGPSPLPAMEQALRHLLACGVGVIVMPCNTAHHWHRDLAARAPVPFPHIVDAAVETLPAAVHSVAVLGTRATLQLGLYHDRLVDRGHVLMDVTAQQAAVDAVIAAVKSGAVATAAAGLQRVLQDCRSRGAGAIILACTELPIAAQAMPARPAGDDLPFTIVDPTLALARKAVELARVRTQP